MQIDWITVAAQIVNFLILVYLLKRFLYRPVTNTMARREQRISDRLEGARQREQEARLEAQRYRERKKGLEEKSEAVLTEARQQAEKERRAQLEEVRQEREELRRQWQGQVEREKAEFLRTLRVQVTDAVSAIVRRVLGDLAHAQLERQVVEVFLSRLESMSEADRRHFRGGAGPVDIITAGELNEDERRRIARSVNDTLGMVGEVRFQQSSEILFGIELRFGGRKFAWTASDYMRAFKSRMEKALAFSDETAAGAEFQEKKHAGASRG
jgi:F-type H+-transporting ATPase subunit b